MSSSRRHCCWSCASRHDREEPPAVAFARSRFRSLLTLSGSTRRALRDGTIGYSRVDDGVWSPVRSDRAAVPDC